MPDETRNAYESERNHDLETMGYNIAITETTKKQDANLRLLAYKAGYNSPSDLLAAMICDLTGWGERESPCAQLMNEWYNNAHEAQKRTYYFRFYLYNRDYEMEDLEEMLSDTAIFESDYQIYLDDCAGEELEEEPMERCLEVAKGILEIGGYI